MKEVHVTLKEWESLGPEDPEGLLAGFQFEDATDRTRAAELTESGTLQIDELYNGLRIQARAHIGRVQLGALIVTVVPKLAAPELLSLFRYAYGLRDITLHAAAPYSASGSLFQDMIIAQLSAEARALLEHGIAWTYVERSEQLASPRGSIDFGQLASRREHATTELPCRHHPRSTDHLLNRVVLAGLTFAQTLANDPELRFALGRQCRLFHELAGVEQLSGNLLTRANRKLNRLVAPYRSLLQLVEILYNGTLVQIDAEDSPRNLSGFLFDMNRFFQRLLERFLQEHLRGARVEREFGLRDLMRYAPAHNPRRRRAPLPRPDYAVMRRGRLLTLLDAKYRNLWETALPNHMLYQLTVYALSQGRGGTAAILYPTTDSSAAAALIEIRDPQTGGSAGSVWLRPVHLGRMVRLVEDDQPAIRAERELWASELAGLA